jgi:F0F1-type ATP synthase membrane subunit b/b'
MRQARQRANEEIQAAKRRIHAEVEAARAELDTSATELAEKIARTILEPPRQEYPRPAGEV